MSLCRHCLAVILMGVPTIGCEVEDDEEVPVVPAPVEPTRPVPQPQVTPGGQTERMLAWAARPADGPAFAPQAG